MRRIGGVVVLVIGGLSVVGCQPGIGACDEERALELAYTDDGIPAFAGQALMYQGCGNGGFCHAASATPEDRLGAPVGLDFDVSPASTSADSSRSTEAENAAVARLEEDRLRALEMRGEVWGQVRDGRMPPGGDVGEDYFAEVHGVDGTANRYDLVTDDAGTEFAPLPGIETEEGQEILRNWLACGAPVVERVVERADREETANFIVPLCVRDPSVCVDLTWPAIVERIVRPGCTSGRCHDDDEPAGALDLTGDPAAVHARLLDAPAAGSGCGPSALDPSEPEVGTPLLTAGDPDASLFLLKLEAGSTDEICGGVMPASGAGLNAQQRCVIREWIACGACADPEDEACRDCLDESERLERCNLATDTRECRELSPCLRRASL
ncbi:MAG TPA: hypothetical protein RMH99_11055 [Sandaracinaceae bacterium LLY-WYZ-13_1]|nr:hypothetical protein [Sandaracinaceae bacterium LLY-WYZ-13_1]